MASLDLARLRAERLRRWHLAGNPIAGAGEAVAFLRHTGFALAHRARTFHLPSFVEALAGTKRGVPAYGDAAGHPLYARYREVRHHPRVARLVVEAPILGRRHALVLRDHLVDFARVLADPPLAERRTTESRRLAERVLGLVADRGPQSKRALRLAFSRSPARGPAPGGVPPAVLDRVLLDLEARLRLVTIGYSEKEGASYDLFARAQRSLAIRAARRSRAVSLDHLVERYVRSALVVEPARVRDVLRGMAGAAEVRASLARLGASGAVEVVREAGAEWLVAPAMLECGADE